MTELIQIFGALTFLAGLALVVRPERIFGFLQKQLAKVELHIFNVVMRIIFGVLMISQSSISNFPFVVETIGWFCIGIAAILTLTSRERFKRIFSWAVTLVETNSRVGAALIMAFGAFLIFAFV